MRRSSRQRGWWRSASMHERTPSMQAYLHQPSKPTPSCCVPLNKFVSTDAKCLCDVFTQEDALNLAKGCGATTDTSFCNIGLSIYHNI
ncbi:hypothetical protein LIER_31481 [Lithospermum erythrorhizon]|uniref:Bifunctional inhibitor/plant lipid transfer protein/seed storage helical domain-containing protein n=1 Tax=Lithospermum erythrorhizon TaxID=34254 RepID=A0AAV3RT07_LITER